MKINKTGLINLFLLCVYWFLVIFLTVFLVSLSIAIVFYFQDGRFYFRWEGEVLNSLRYGLSGGLPLGIGIWFMAWMKARKQT
ncbi:MULTISPECIES: hypothetical protein [Serratia]|uniref:Immunity protein n=2 Tax=Serratia TaxID=613 RepID=A0AAW6XEW8_9GAMM|nr:MULTISPECIES: hypothetical protein [Serratia]AVU35642.1 hypothetical protein AM681_13865 [Serratia marcescens]AVU40751.1 hypothetical protein AS658_13730 [Serratia marcescens]EGT0505747.1 hypothetical protein [Serratia marcescens]EGT3597769.1 hypothetical protein [Serratia marcescens]EHT9831648.1 hypothetical protein [Serratia marcescens]